MAIQHLASITPITNVPDQTAVKGSVKILVRSLAQKNTAHGCSSYLSERLETPVKTCGSPVLPRSFGCLPAPSCSKRFRRACGSAGASLL